MQGMKVKPQLCTIQGKSEEKNSKLCLGRYIYSLRGKAKDVFSYFRLDTFKSLNCTFSKDNALTPIE